MRYRTLFSWLTPVAFSFLLSVIAVGAVLFVMRQAIPQWSHPEHPEVGYEVTVPSQQEPGPEG